MHDQVTQVTAENTKSKQQKIPVKPFVDFVVKVTNDDRKKGVRAALRCADNPLTEYQSWEQLADFHVDLTSDNQRLPCATIAAAMVKAKATHNGSLGIGEAIANCYKDGNQSDQAKAKLRRLLACDTTEEVCRILRLTLALVNSKGTSNLDYVCLLKDLLDFCWDDKRQQIKAKWAQDFYGYRDKENDNESENEEEKNEQGE